MNEDHKLFPGLFIDTSLKSEQYFIIAHPVATNVDHYFTVFFKNGIGNYLGRKNYSQGWPDLKDAIGQMKQFTDNYTIITTEQYMELMQAYAERP